VLAMVIAAATDSSLAALMKWIVDGTFIRKDAGLGTLLALAIIGLAVLRLTAGVVSTFAISWVGNRLVLDLREKMFERLLNAPTGYYDDHASGNLISKLTYDVTNVTSAATSVVTIAVKDALTIAGLLAWLWYLNWKLTLVSLTVAPLLAWMVRKFSRRLRQVSRGAQRAMGGITQVIEETIEGNRVVKIFGGHAYEAQRFREAANKVRRFGIKQAAAAGANSAMGEFVAALMLALIVFLVARQAAADETTVGSFVSFITAVMMLLAPLKRLTGINEPLQRGLAAAESVFELMDEAPEVDRGTIEIGRARGAITFEHVTFKYPSSGAPALADVNLTIEPGETIALVGTSGSGKTTFASLLSRFYDPSTGRITLDGHDLREIKLASLRANIAFVSQDVVLFNDTVAANIAYGPLVNTPERGILAAAQAAHAMDFIGAMPQGMQTLIGENGVKLSGGERQRLAIARAILKDARILILDEATSALDSESERQVQAALDNLMQNRTTIVIAHRLSTIENSGRIVVLERGRVIETGNHAALLAADGAYARLHRVQFQGAQARAKEAV
jgi:ATP-binding cassette, subfamily B, bacterial MsbA